MAIKLIYFPISGRAEVARLLLSMGKVDFEDVRVKEGEWPALKPNMPFGQMPVLEVDGKQLAQMGAIDLYCAKITGVMPQDPWEAALADQAYCFCEDIWKLFMPTMSIKDEEQRRKARQEVVEGPLKEKMGYLSKLLERKPGRFVAGEAVTHGDLGLFVTLSTMLSGFLDGVPQDLLKAYPDISAYRNSVASLEGVKAFYDEETDPNRAAFKPDDTSTEE